MGQAPQLGVDVAIAATGRVDLYLGVSDRRSAQQTLGSEGEHRATRGQTFQFDTDVLLDKITFKARTTQNVSGVPLLLWFGTGYTSQTSFDSSGLSSLII